MKQSIKLLFIVCSVATTLSLFAGEKTETNFDLLRSEFGKKDNFDELCLNNRPLKEADLLLQKEEWQGTIDLLAPWVESCSVDMRANFFLKVAHMKLGNEEKVTFYGFQYAGLLQSVLDSGDGKSEDTAWQTISVAEEYDTMYLIYFQPEGQALSGFFVDIISGQFQGGKKATLYFNPAARTLRMMKKLGIKVEQKPNPQAPTSGHTVIMNGNNHYGKSGFKFSKNKGV